MRDGVVGEPGHASTPNSERTSARYSASDAVASCGNVENDGAETAALACESFVTAVSLIPKRRSVSRYVARFASSRSYVSKRAKRVASPPAQPLDSQTETLRAHSR